MLFNFQRCEMFGFHRRKEQLRWRIKRIPWPKTCGPRSEGVYTPHATDFNFYILFRREHFVSMNLRNNFRMNQGGGNGMKKNRTTSSSNP